MSKWGRRRRAPPAGFAEDVEPTLTALEDELRQRMEDPVEGVGKAETLWPVHQINWQKTRYVYKLYYKYGRISEEVYKYCVDQGLVDKALIAKWKKPGYERLCSTYVINTRNYPYGTTSICRVPLSERKAGDIRDNVTGCRGCASGAEGFSNVFGNKYGQDLAKLQILRERFEAEQKEDKQKASTKTAALEAVSKSRTTWASDEQSKALRLDQEDEDEDEEDEDEEDEDKNEDAASRDKDEGKDETSKAALDNESEEKSQEATHKADHHEGAQVASDDGDGPARKRTKVAAPAE